MPLVTVYRTFSPADAHLIRSRLEAADLHATVSHELSALSMEGYSLSTGGVLVQVPESEAEEARELIAAKDGDEP
jgi:signal transduction histidine kinase